jgi:hypothetical protein
MVSLTAYPKTTTRSYSPQTLSTNSLSNSANNTQIKSMSKDLGVKAIILKSWGGNNHKDLIWEHLNDNWSKYGNVPIFIDDSSYIDISNFSKEDLLNSKADVIILSDPAGHGYAFSQNEIIDLKDYLFQGHNLIGTYMVFRFEWIPDNRALAPLFGFGSSINFSTTALMPCYEHNGGKLFINIGSLYCSSGYDNSQVPSRGFWTQSDLNGAEIVGSTKDKKGIITLFKGDNFNSLYISSMPEFKGGNDDAQFLYNMITYSTNSSGFDIVTDLINIGNNCSIIGSYPNPFNSRTKIRYTLREQTHAVVAIYDLSGRIIDILVDKFEAAGNYEITWIPKDKPSGIYFCKLRSGNFSKMTKLLYQK